MGKRHNIGWGPIRKARIARAGEMWQRELANQKRREASRAVDPAARRAGAIRLFFYELLTQLITLLAFLRTRLIQNRAMGGVGGPHA